MNINNQIIKSDETVLFSDETIDGTECLILTDKRIYHLRNGKVKLEAHYDDIINCLYFDRDNKPVLKPSQTSCVKLLLWEDRNEDISKRYKLKNFPKCASVAEILEKQGVAHKDKIYTSKVANALKYVAIFTSLGVMFMTMYFFATVLPHDINPFLGFFTVFLLPFVPMLFCLIVLMKVTKRIENNHRLKEKNREKNKHIL